MKKHLFILILTLPIFVWQGVKGQQYQQVVIPNSSVWLIAHDQLAGRFIDTLYAKDVSNSETELWYKYNQLVFIGVTISDTSNSKLYFKPSQTISPNDTSVKLIFDLNLDVGDTFTFGNYIDTVANVFTLNGKKHIEFKNANTNWGEKIRFIEGVGPNIGVFVNYLGILNPFVACKYELDSLVYVTLNDNFNGCMLLPTDIKKNNLESMVEISPNPFSDFIEIRSNLLDAKTMVSIINITGQKLFESEINSEIFIIPTNNLLPGIYFVNIQSKNEKLTKKIIKL